jgi:hypothetical protein
VGVVCGGAAAGDRSRPVARTPRSHPSAAPPTRRGAPSGGRPGTTSPDWRSSFPRRAPTAGRGGLRTTTAGARTGRSRRRGPRPPGAGRRGWCGWPPDVQRLPGAPQHDRYHRRVAGQHPQRRRGQGAAEIQARGAGAALQIRQPDHHVQLRATPTARGQRGAGLQFGGCAVGDPRGLTPPRPPTAADPAAPPRPTRGPGPRPRRGASSPHPPMADQV